MNMADVSGLIISLGGGGRGGAEVDDITIGKNADGKLEVKDGGIGEEKLDGELKSKVNKDFASLERLGNYLYKVTFDTIPDYVDGNSAPVGGCSAFVRDGKLFRNFDWNYDNTATFMVKCKTFEGIGSIVGLNDSNLDMAKVGQLPYHIVDGVNTDGIMVSTHVLYNDFGYEGSGDKDQRIMGLPYFILSNVHSMADLETAIADYLANLNIPTELAAMEYLVQFIVTDGTTTKVITPKTDGSGYEVVDATDNPKLTNFKWVADATVVRAALQNRPTGVERWNLIGANTKLEDLKFTFAYESPDRLSEFIGIDGTTKDSTDAELEAIYDEAHAEYLIRTRDGATWQTVHSVVYGINGIESLCVQEDYAKDYIVKGGGIVVHKTVRELPDVGEQGTLYTVLSPIVAKVTTIDRPNIGESQKFYKVPSTLFGYPVSLAVDMENGTATITVPGLGSATLPFCIMAPSVLADLSINVGAGADIPVWPTFFTEVAQGQDADFRCQVGSTVESGQNILIPMGGYDITDLPERYFYKTSRPVFQNLNTIKNEFDDNTMAFHNLGTLDGQKRLVKHIFNGAVEQVSTEEEADFVITTNKIQRDIFDLEYLEMTMQVRNSTPVYFYQAIYDNNDYVRFNYLVDEVRDPQSHHAVSNKLLYQTYNDLVGTFTLIENTFTQDGNVYPAPTTANMDEIGRGLGSLNPMKICYLYTSSNVTHKGIINNFTFDEIRPTDSTIQQVASFVFEGYTVKATRNTDFEAGTDTMTYEVV